MGRQGEEPGAALILLAEGATLHLSLWLDEVALRARPTGVGYGRWPTPLVALSPNQPPGRFF